VGPAERMRETVVQSPTGLRIMIGLAVVSAGVLLVGVIWAARRDIPPPDDRGDVVRVGVVQGQSVPGYLGSARAELAALTDPSAPAAADTWALVSLDDYVPPPRLPGLLEGAAVAQVYARVPLPGAHTQVVRIPVYRMPADVSAGMLDAALQRDQEQAEYLQLSRNVEGDNRNAERARDAYETAAGTAAAEAAAYRSGCSCVFAAVVRAAPPALRSIADRPGVRAVDPAPEVLRLDRTEFRPPLPEQIGTVPQDPGRTSTPVPTGGPGIASRTPAPLLSSLGVTVTSAAPDGSARRPVTPAPPPKERTAVPSAPDASAAQDAASTPPAASRARSGR
jgi:hypothetical protein